MSGGCLVAMIIFIIMMLICIAALAIILLATAIIGVSVLSMGIETNVTMPVHIETETVTETETEDYSETESGEDISAQEDTTVTVMIYLNGTDLEEYGSGYATSDIEEILAADSSDSVNIIIQTIGTTEWEYEGISGDTSQRFLAKDGELICLEEDLGLLDVTEQEPLTDFIMYSAEEYPADRYFLIMWNHGGGPVYGFGVNSWDEDAYESLMLDEIQFAIQDSGVYFDMIGFDACLMGSMEVAYALRDCSDYLIASEDFEPGDGWEYEGWISMLVRKPDISIPDLGRMIVDDFAEESEEAGEPGILAVIDLAYSEILYKAWTEFAYEAEDTLLASNFSFEMDSEGRAGIRPFRSDLKDLYEDYYSDDAYYDATLEEYCAVDMMAAASCIESDASNELIAALNFAICYAAATAEDRQMTGLSVTLPYGDEYTYLMMKPIFMSAGFDRAYVDWLYAFVLEGSYAGDYDWDDWEWGGWSDNAYDEDIDWEDSEWLWDLLEVWETAE